MRLLAVAAVAACLLPPGALAQDAEAGAAKAKICGACHDLTDAGQSRLGPPLHGVVGRTAGAVENYSYSTAMTEAGSKGLVWTPDQLALYLRKPRDMIAGTRMAFAGFADEADIANVIAYLVTLSPDYRPEAAAGRPPAPAAPQP